MRIWAMTARRTTIRQLPLTEVVDRNTSGATPVSISTTEGGTIYHTAPLADPPPAGGATTARSGSQAPFLSFLLSGSLTARRGLRRTSGSST